jgi:hypothetical protein
MFITNYYYAVLLPCMSYYRVSLHCIPISIIDIKYTITNNNYLLRDMQRVTNW